MFTVLCRHAHSDWQHTEAFLYVIGKSNLCNQGNKLLALTLKGNTIQNIVYYIHIVEIPTQKVEHSWKCIELSLKRNEKINNM